MPPQRISIGLVGPSSHTNNAHQTARTIGLYPEMGDADAKAPVALFSTPGLLLLADLATYVPGAGEIRGCYPEPKRDRLFVVAGNSLVEVQGLGSYHVWGTIPTSKGPVVISSNADVIIVGDGAGFWAFDLIAGTVEAVLSSGDPILGFFSAYIDGRTLYLERDTDRFLWSDINDPTTVNGLSFATAEGNPDPAQAMFIVNREVIFPGRASIEFWAPTTDNDNPFQRISGGYREVGCAAQWAAKPFADSVIFIGQDRSGHAQVYLQGSAGNPAQPISNHAVEKDIRVALRDYNVADSRSFEYTEPGHKFWVLNLPQGVTWAYDLATNLWHERVEVDAETGLYKQIRQEHHAFWRGEHYVGGAESAKLYKQGRPYRSLAGDPLIRLRETPHIHAEGRWMTFNRLIVDMSVATALDGTGQGTDPALMMQFSDDGGNTWSNEITRSIGKIGAFKTEVSFGPTGRSRNRVFRFSVSDPVDVIYVAGWAIVTIGG